MKFASHGTVANHGAPRLARYDEKNRPSYGSGGREVMVIGAGSK